MLTCPECGLQQNAEAPLRLTVCRRCDSQGRTVYLSGARPNPRRDLIGLLSAARAQLSESRERSAPRP
jgi:hypothetical protein